MVKIQKNVSLKNYSNFKIGGPADYFLTVKNTEDLIRGLESWKKISEKFVGNNKKIFILGRGTNLLISDTGFKGLVIHNDIKFIEEKDGLIKAGSAVLVKDLLDYCVENSLSGIEWAGGLPGTVGGAVRGNAGAFGGEIKSVVDEITSLEVRNNVLIHHYKNRDCEFGYRTSVFKTNPGKVIISAVFKLKKGDKKKIEREIEEKKAYRKNRHPLEYPNIGSIFKNMPLEKVSKNLREEFENSIKIDPFPVLPTAKLISASGLAGRRVGDAQVSQKHPNFIINLGHAKSEEVLELINIVKKTIKNKFGIKLEEEITVLG